MGLPGVWHGADLHAGQAGLRVPREQGSVWLKMRRRSDIPVFRLLGVQGGACSHLPPPFMSRITASGSLDERRSVERKGCPGNAGSQAGALAECLEDTPGPVTGSVHLPFLCLGSLQQNV